MRGSSCHVCECGRVCMGVCGCICTCVVCVCVCVIVYCVWLCMFICIHVSLSLSLSVCMCMCMCICVCMSISRCRRSATKALCKISNALPCTMTVLLRYAQVSKETYMYGGRGLLTSAYLRYASIGRSLFPYNRSLLTHTHTSACPIETRGLYPTSYTLNPKPSVHARKVRSGLVQA